MYKLYGNGINDDTLAIQEMLDSRISVVELPVPEKHYCISKTLKIYSNQTLKLGETTTIKLLPNSNCEMLTNAEKDAENIVVTGGIWDFNNLNQCPNPSLVDPTLPDRCHRRMGNTAFVDYDTIGYIGCIMTFTHITRFSIHDLTLKDPTTYCLRMAYVKYFTVENIRFDQNHGNPSPVNMDGVHIDGGCRFGSIRNVQGTCYDDIVAINADDGYDGPIEDIEVDGVFGNDTLRGVRLLSTKSLVARISISNVFGTFYQNAVGLTYFYQRDENRGKMSHISIRNIFASNAPRYPMHHMKDKSVYKFAFLWIDGALDIDSVTVDNLFRKEELGKVETIKVCKDTKIRTLSLSNILQDNNTGEPMTLLLNEGEIERLYMHNVDSMDDELIVNNGTIGKIVDNR